MSKSTPAERAYMRWYAEKNPRGVLAALRGPAEAVGGMEPRLRELLEEELARAEAGNAEEPTAKPNASKSDSLSVDYLKVRTSEAANRFDVTAKTIREWAKGEKPPKRIKPSDCRGYVLVHPGDWKT